MRDDITKNYSNGEITVVWKPKLCTHSSNCWKGLLTVFNPQVRPWIDMNGADTDRIIAQVDQCPSGALSYFRDEGAATEANAEPTSTTVVEVTTNGPLVVSGGVTIKMSDGVEKQLSRTVSLCRCGQSNNKPFCDGSHTRAGFSG